MDNNTAAVTITALIMLPGLLWILRAGRNKQGGAQTAADTAHMNALHETAQRMERRIESLEMLLDHELPGWRSRSRTP